MPNRFGLYDMGGNVFQWCEDSYRSKMNSEMVLKLIPDMKNDWGRVLRGSPWHNASPEYLLSSFHGRGSNRSTNTGFRCVLTTESSR
jgi:formylglycine-generating enzyme required for sulfatase activity